MRYFSKECHRCYLCHNAKWDTQKAPRKTPLHCCIYENCCVYLLPPRSEPPRVALPRLDPPPLLRVTLLRVAPELLELLRPTLELLREALLPPLRVTLLRLLALDELRIFDSLRLPPLPAPVTLSPRLLLPPSGRTPLALSLLGRLLPPTFGAPLGRPFVPPLPGRPT